MIKNTNLCIDLKTIMQEDALLTQGQTYRGVLTRDGEEHFLFEEEAPRKVSRDHRNPKLFDGRYCSLVHMSNGRYQVHMKTIEAIEGMDPEGLAFKVYSELLNAFQIIN